MSYLATETVSFAERLKALGFVVYLAKRKDYGFFTDEKGERVITFGFRDGGNLGGNYGPPSRESGTGWRLDNVPSDIRTAADARRILYSSAPPWCGKGWKNYTTAEQHLKTYGPSSGYERF